MPLLKYFFCLAILLMTTSAVPINRQALEHSGPNLILLNQSKKKLNLRENIADSEYRKEKKRINWWSVAALGLFVFALLLSLLGMYVASMIADLVYEPFWYLLLGSLFGGGALSVIGFIRAKNHPDKFSTGFALTIMLLFAYPIGIICFFLSILLYHYIKSNF